VEVEDRLSASRPDVDDHAVILEPRLARSLGDEVEHAFRFVGRELADLAEAVEMPLGKHEQVRLSLGIDVADRDEAVALADVVSLPDQLTEEAVVRQRGSLPP
jgi:hypothetical protein